MSKSSCPLLAEPPSATPDSSYVVVDTTNNLVASFVGDPTTGDFEDVHLGLIMLIRPTDRTYFDRASRTWMRIPPAEMEVSTDGRERHQPPFY